MKQNKNGWLYTRHGKKRSFGKPITVQGVKALGYFEGEELKGYTTLEELQEFFYRAELTEYDFVR